ncbi:benzoyl-CoA reductase/2-hydroxyglutaryl-CoA dehydratase subunit BcrC/BadD/HgdB [Desulfitispora alkaliphila]|uniref:double-cubane-cluster-containing anaerobic reductase n=1 Tax=Desulfitispora alkaliphila TaxID=622674 RepID=UPI003D1F56E8
MEFKAMEYFDSLIPKSGAMLKEEKERGRNVVGYYCVFSPIELIEAAGAIPVGLCATKQEPIMEAEKVLPRNLCPLIKSSYGFAVSGKCPFFNLSDFVMAETTCDGKKKMYELMQRDKPMIVLDIPNTTNLEWRKEHWLREVMRTKAYIEERIGTEITSEKLSEVIAMYNRERKLLMELVSLNKNNPAPLPATDLLKVLWGRNFQVDREGFEANVKELIQEVKAALDKGTIDKPKGPRILVTGSPTGIGQEKVMDILEEAGAQIVLQESCSGIKGYIDLVDETIDPFEAVAQKYMDIPCSCSSPNDRRFEITGRLVDEYQVDGVVDITLQACHTYNIESYSLKEYLKEHHKTPLLQVETDYSESDVQQIKLRVDAFLELL